MLGNASSIAMRVYVGLLIYHQQVIIIMESAVQGRERVRTLYQSKDLNPTQPTHGRKEKIKQ